VAKHVAKKPAASGAKPVAKAAKKSSGAVKSSPSRTAGAAKASALKLAPIKSGGSAAASSAVKTAAPAKAVSTKSNRLDKSRPPTRDRAGNGDNHQRFPNNAPVPLAPVPTNGKPRKNQAGLSPKELENFRELLLAKRRELVGDMSSMEREALRSGVTNLSNLPMHMADQGTDNYEQEFTLGLVEKDRELLREINRALAKIMDGSYGICEGTGKPISKPRLEAQPWAKYSIEYARQLERPGFRR
jgi:DnaK suppressor protein